MTLLLLVFRMVGAVRLRESVTRLKENLQITYHRKEHQRHFDHAVILMRNARTFDDWWQGLCVAAQEMELAWISIRLQARDGTDRTLVWRNEKLNPDPDDLVDVTLPLRQRRADQNLRLEFASVAPQGALEYSSHHAGLFTRLVDEYNLTTLPEGEKLENRIQKSDVRNQKSDSRSKTRSEAESTDRIKPSLKVQPQPGTGGS